MGNSATSSDKASAGAVAALESFSAVAPFDIKGFQRALDQWLAPWHMESTPPWLVGWYNRSRDETAGGVQKLEFDDGALAFAIYTVPMYLDVVTEHFARCKPDGNFVDAATNEVADLLKKKLSSDLEPLVINTDVGPPYYHVQSVGAICGMDHHLEDTDIDDAEWCEELRADLEDSRDPKMWGTDPATRRKIFGVNVHPKYGGWYAYRLLLIIPRVTNEMLPAPLEQPAALKFLDEDNAKRILREYNLQHDRCVWRDLCDAHPAELRYTPEEYFYFTETQPAKRKRFLQVKSAHFKSTPQARG